MATVRATCQPGAEVEAIVYSVLLPKVLATGGDSHESCYILGRENLERGTDNAPGHKHHTPNTQTQTDVFANLCIQRKTFTPFSPF